MIDVSYSESFETIPFDAGIATDFAEFVLKSIGKEDKSLSIAFVSSDEIRGMNRDYRGKDKPTDVLSFCFAETPETPDDSEDSGLSDGNSFFDSDNLGEIYISPAQVSENIQGSSEMLQTEFLRVIAHGILHLSGYCHDDDADIDDVLAELGSEGLELSDAISRESTPTRRMFALQEKLLAEYSASLGR